MTDNSPLATGTTQLHERQQEAGRATREQRRDGWTVVLRRQPARIVDGRPEGPYTDAFEIICCDCGDDPGLEYTDVSRKLQLIRGPYPIAVGIAAYETHLKLHCQTEAGASDGAVTDAV
jgi:hypothetical protein